MATQYLDIPAVASPRWKAPVANAAALPPANNTDGDARVTLNDKSIYIWNEGTTAWLQAATPAATSAITALNTDVTAVGPGAVVATVNSVGGSSAANVHSAELLANAAASTNTVSTIVKRDASGNFSAGTITANLTGNASGSAGSFTGSLVGDVTGTQGATTISTGAVTDTKAALAAKPACTVVATTNQTKSGFPTIDGVTVVEGSIILLSAQTAGEENGPWVSHVGAWTRPTWYPSAGTVQAFQYITTLIRVGATYQGTTWRMTTSGAITIDTTATVWIVTPLAINASSVTGTLPIANGGTAANTAADARTSLGVAPINLPINTQTASYTLVLSDNGSYVRMNVAGANTLTVPPNSSVAFPIGTQILFGQPGAGQTTITPGAAVTINAADAALKLRVQYSVGGLVKIDTDAWTAFGDLSV